MLFITERGEETILVFPQGTVRVLFTLFLFITVII